MKADGFHFGTPITIAGKVYYLDLNRDGVKERLEELRDKIQDEVPHTKKTGDASVMFSLTKEFIDTAFGAGTFDTIFSGRIMSSYDLNAFTRYIAQEAKRETQRLRRQNNLRIVMK